MSAAASKAYGFIKNTVKACPIFLIPEGQWSDWLTEQSASVQAWVASTGFKPTKGARLVAPNAEGSIALVAVITADSGPDQWTLAPLVDLPAGKYRVAEKYDTAQATALALGWALGQYRFDRFKAAPAREARLCIPARANMAVVATIADGMTWGRDMINLPTNHMGPGDLELAAYKLTETFDAKVKVITGDQLIKKNFPAIHAVGRASSSAPRLIDIKWGRTTAPKITLVGKGVCFDTGGLDIKPSSAMLMMKKDMGGAASVLALAHMIMASGIDIRLRVLVPAVENSISGNAFRPGDILDTRKGKTVVVGNTDAEGRLILCDALTYADEESPDVIIDMATLTGAARVALGTELPALFTNSDTFAEEVTKVAEDVDDPLWRLPLWANYRARLDSPIADTNNISSGPFGGAITAALFLEGFVSSSTDWVHIDTYGWNDQARPGRPAGGEVLVVRALYALLHRRYGTAPTKTSTPKARAKD